jgi:hypothetical protein
MLGRVANNATKIGRKQHMDEDEMTDAEGCGWMRIEWMDTSK